VSRSVLREAGGATPPAYSPYELKLRGLLYGKFADVGASEDVIHVGRSQSERLDNIVSVGDQSTVSGPETIG
jgi:hypothetical protein